MIINQQVQMKLLQKLIQEQDAMLTTAMTTLEVRSRLNWFDLALIPNENTALSTINR